MVNKRITSRFRINISGIIYLYIEDANSPTLNKELSEPIEIINISYNGIQIVFSDNEFLSKLFNIKENYEIFIEFEFQKRDYKFKVSKKWEKIYDLAEYDYYTSLGFVFDESEYEKESLIDLLLILYFQDVYFGK